MVSYVVFYSFAHSEDFCGFEILKNLLLLLAESCLIRLLFGHTEIHTDILLCLLLELVTPLRCHMNLFSTKLHLRSLHHEFTVGKEALLVDFIFCKELVLEVSGVVDIPSFVLIKPQNFLL